MSTDFSPSGTSTSTYNLAPNEISPADPPLSGEPYRVAYNLRPIPESTFADGSGFLVTMTRWAMLERMVRTLLTGTVTFLPLFRSGTVLVLYESGGFPPPFLIRIGNVLKKCVEVGLLLH